MLAIAIGASLWGLWSLLTGELAWPWKAIATGLAVAAITMQFVPALGVHFLIPFLMEIAVAMWAYFSLIWPRDI